MILLISWHAFSSFILMKLGTNHEPNWIPRVFYTCKLPLQCQFLRDFLRFTFPRNILIFSLFDSFIFLPFRSYQLILLGFVLLSEVAFRRWQSILSSICTFSDDLAKKAMLFHILWRWNVDKTWFESKTN